MSFLQTFNGRTARSFRPKAVSSKPATALREYAEATLGSDSLREAVRLPDGESIEEWVAVHVVEFFNQTNMLYSTISKLCTVQSCPRMTATTEYEYLWQDPESEKYRLPTKVSAPEYIECLMAWVQHYFEDPKIFPTALGVEFGPQAMAVFRNILKRLFRVYAHIYCHHFDQITELGLQLHLNTSLKHFVLFCNEFRLVNPSEWGPLADLLALLEEQK